MNQSDNEAWAQLSLCLDGRRWKEGMNDARNKEKLQIKQSGLII